MIRTLDLFSGIGGFSLGLERTGGFETVAFCEIEKFPQQVLKKHWPDVPIFEDVRTLNADGLGRIDCIVGGYPCQPFSVAGERRGAEDDRHLWPEMYRLVASIRPRWVIAENVAGHINMGLDEVLSDLESEEYTAVPLVIPACAVDAPHRRDRVWIVAHAKGHRYGQGGKTGNVSCSDGGQVGQVRSVFGGASAGSEVVAHASNNRAGRRQQQPKSGESTRDVAHTDDTGLQRGEKARNIGGKRQGREKQPERCCDNSGSTWLPEPDVGQWFDGISERLDGGIDADTGWIQVSRSKNAEGLLRGLRLYKDALRPSYQRGLDGQQPVQHQDALFFLSHVFASQAGRPDREATEAAVHSLWEAVLSLKSEALQHPPHQIAEIWQSLSSEETDWAIVAACLGCFWAEHPNTPRVATGVPRRVDRLKALGNAVVPQIPEIIGRAILEVENDYHSSPAP